MKQSSHTPKAPDTVVIRPCQPADLAEVAKLAARLVREHHAMDPARFMIFDNIEEGYAAYLGGEIRRKTSVVLVAVVGDRVVGYAYGRMEARDWNALRDRCGALHDVYVADTARKSGIGAALVHQMVKRLAALGAPRVVLMTATQNLSAQRLFERLGFRTTMLEMTKEAAPQ